MYNLLIIVIIVAVASFVWNIRLQKEILKRKLVEQELKELNTSLKSKIQKAVSNVKHQERLLIQQSRLIQMGEMINMIAHQWRQPLGAINSAIINLKMNIASQRYNLDNLEQREELFNIIDTKHTNITEYVKFLSTTIDDFRNFFKPIKEKETVPLSLPITRALQIVEDSMISKSIIINKDFIIDANVTMYQNELMQVILNILKNSEENFIEHNIQNATIDIVTKESEKTFAILIYDNGGGIPKNILSNIYTPYFSTKKDKNGTGLGLYMSKIIIEEHNNGILHASNTNDGVCFEIVLFK